MKIKVRATYNRGPLRGSIHIVEMVGRRPTCYALKLFSQKDITLVRDPKINRHFRSVNDAIAFAARHGFLSHLWSIDERVVD